MPKHRQPSRRRFPPEVARVFLAWVGLTAPGGRHMDNGTTAKATDGKPRKSRGLLRHSPLSKHLDNGTAVCGPIKDEQGAII
jgi:hypothetical protein